MQRSRGFTLVEIAIVTVIAGLLVGGVLKGQELVNQARAKNLINDFNGVQSAVLAYRDRYGVWPGDDNTAAARWSATYGAVGGNGDGQIGGNYHDLTTAAESANPTTVTGESKLFWWHLRIAGFVFGPISGPGAADLPVTAAGGILGVQNSPASFLTGPIACANDVPDKTAIAVDAQLDDLRPAQGLIRSRLQAGSGAPQPITALSVVTDYTEGQAKRYTVCRQL